MRYFVLYQQVFSGPPRPLAADSHVFVDYTTATDLEVGEDGRAHTVPEPPEVIP